MSEHEYERSDIVLRDDHPLAAPYPWAASRDVTLTVRYTGSGMAAIAAWYLALAKLTTDVTVVTNTLYYETETLFELCPAAHVRVEPCADRDGFLRRLRTASGPVVAFLDSCQPFGDAAMVREVLARDDEPGPLAVVWDNACAPIAADPCPGGWTGCRSSCSAATTSWTSWAWNWRRWARRPSRRRPAWTSPGGRTPRGCGTCCPGC